MCMFKFFKGPGGGFAPALVGRVRGAVVFSLIGLPSAYLNKFKKNKTFSDRFALNVNCRCNFHGMKTFTRLHY